MVGITNVTNVSFKNITDILNFTSGDPTEFFINVNQIVYGGWLFFMLLWVLTVILYRTLQDWEDQPLLSAMEAVTITTIVSLFFRAIFIIKDGLVEGLITDYQMWMFPILMALLAAINFMTKEK